MPDDRYLEGDPNAPAVAMRDLSPFVASAAQHLALIADLIEAGRTADAKAHALSLKQTALSILRDMEVPALPEVDVTRTQDTARRSEWRFKGED
jgi:hypothetical protein